MKHQYGMTLIEIMISLLLGLMVVGGTLSIYLTSIRNSADINKSARLNYDLDTVSSLMVNDIRRAGYWGKAVLESNALNDLTKDCSNESPPPPTANGNPFTCGNANIIISEKTGEALNSCILYTYDVDDANPDTPETPDGILNLNEYFGFRLHGDGIDMRFSVNDEDNDGVPDGTDCDSGNWESIIQTNQLTINNVNFNMNNSKCFSVTANTPCPASSGDNVIETRQITITLTGIIKKDSSATKSMSSVVTVLNNWLYIQS